MYALAPSAASKIRETSDRILITGASGWLGRATLDLLHHALGSSFHERVYCFGSKRRVFALSDTRMIEQRPILELADFPNSPSLLLHFAFLTKDRAEQMHEAEYRAANRAISQTVIDALGGIGVGAVFVASSGAAARADDPTASAAMRLYGALKRADEDAFAHWAQTVRARLVLARIYNLSGPHINKPESYALASFILDALAGGPIEVRAPHDVVRGYVAIRELMSLVFALLLRGGPDIIRFDTGGDPIELGRLAEAVAAHSGGCSIERPDRTSGEDRYAGDHIRYAALLKAEGIGSVPLEHQIAETAEYLSIAR